MAFKWESIFFVSKWRNNKWCYLHNNHYCKYKPNLSFGSKFGYVKGCLLGKLHTNLFMPRWWSVKRHKLRCKRH
ncbi:hypothetical protein GF1_16340 [Desulfolithobacter dissulfuricans]|uniref:Uncharacterized protein n=1 Tax=Desulfolithobacter dissulfuricans TaxID=2795293 RepID=A0A915U0K1_9BACT|nr:hypothetical protein GF1_16340 [Desulfolithobacter dissulfuricans]